MRDSGDELRLLREAVAALRQRLDTLEADAGIGGKALAAKTVSGGSYPTRGPGITFLVQAYDVTGVETEGSAGVLTARGGTFPAVMIGSGLPTAGTELIVEDVGSAYVFSYRA